MAIELTVTAKGQITLRQEVLAHLGIGPGDKVVVDLLPDGRLQARAKPGLPMTALVGALRRPGQPAVTIDQMNEAIAAGWAGER